MRRLALLCLPIGALAVPAAALAFTAATGDGSLVVKNGTGPAKAAVVTLVINGTVIGHVSSGSPDQVDTVVIVDANNTGNVAASSSTNSSLTRTSSIDPTYQAPKTKLVGSDFRFRAASGVYRVTIYGAGVDLFAVGQGKVTLQGSADSTVSDGHYSINGGDWHSLPAQASDWLPIASSG
jgi:hypothetical protein